MRCRRPRRARKSWGAGVFKIIVARARALARGQSLPPPAIGPGCVKSRSRRISVERIAKQDRSSVFLKNSRSLSKHTKGILFYGNLPESTFHTAWATSGLVRRSTGALFDHPVGVCEHGGRDRETVRLR